MIPWFRTKKNTAPESLPQETEVMVMEAVVEPPVPIIVNPPMPTVAEIHETFFTEVDKLLEEARIFRSTEIKNPTVFEKGKRLANLGFTSAKTVQESKEEQKRLDKIAEENANKQLLVNAIEYFSNKYPLYRFITMSSINRICEKYGLKHGAVYLYEGEVPDKNLNEIENAKIDDNDRVYAANSEYSSGKQFFSKKEYDDYRRSDNNYLRYYGWDKLGFIIAAPRKDFRSNTHVEGNQIMEKPVPLDPIVMMPVMFESKVFYLIISAWGDEASDPEVVNMINN